MQSHNQQDFVNRFVAVCQDDERVLAAILYGSHAKGTADEYSDLDLGLFTTDMAYEEFVDGLTGFIKQLGEPVFLKKYPKEIIFYVFPDGVEGQLCIGRESKLGNPSGPSSPYNVLLDKKNILVGAEFPLPLPKEDEQRKILRNFISGWFWHDVSCLIRALGRGQLWWAYGQLEEIRRYYVGLARLHNNFLDHLSEYVPGFPYEKVDEVLPVEQLSSLQATCCQLEPDAILKATLEIISLHRELASHLAQVHGIAYPAGLDRVMSERLEKLSEAICPR